MNSNILRLGEYLDCSYTYSTIPLYSTCAVSAREVFRLGERWKTTTLQCDIIFTLTTNNINTEHNEGHNSQRNAFRLKLLSMMISEGGEWDTCHSSTHMAKTMNILDGVNLRTQSHTVLKYHLKKWSHKTTFMLVVNGKRTRNNMFRCRPK